MSAQARREMQRAAPLCFLFQRKRNFAPHCRGDGRQRGYSLSQKRIPPLEPPEEGLIGSLDLEGVQRLRNAAALRAALPRFTLRYDLTCSYYPLPLCLSCFSADESPPTVSPIKAASAAKPPPSPASPSKGGERSNAADAQAVRRQTTVTRALRSARGCNMNRLAGTRGEATYTAPDSAGCAALRAKDCQCAGSRGKSPRLSLGGFKGGYSLRKESIPLCLSVALSAALSHAAPTALQPPSPARGIKRDTLFEKRIPPFSGSSAKSCTNSCSAAGAATPISREGEAIPLPLRGKNP